MSKWPALLSGVGVGEKQSFHVHHPSEVRGVFSDVVVEGDVRSANWDGSGSLAGGADSSASRGFLLDSASGAAQFTALYWGTGSTMPLTTAGTWAAAGVWTLPAALGRITSTVLTEGLPVSADVLVDMTVEVEASGFTAGQSWLAQPEVQGTVRGLGFWRGTPSAATVSISGTTGADGTGNTGSASAEHTHTFADTSSNASGDHAHGAGSLATDASGASNSGYESSHAHDSGSYKVAKDPEYWDVAGTSSAGSQHRHSTPNHAHDVNGTTNTGGQFHTHDVAGTTSAAGSTSHAHTGPSHQHTFSDTDSHAHTVAYDSQTVRWIGVANTGGAGQLQLGVQARTSGTAATVNKVQISYMVWQAPLPPTMNPDAAAVALTAPQATPVIT